MTVIFSRRMDALARSRPYRVRLLSNSGPAGELRYFGPSAPGRVRPPRAAGRPEAALIGMMILPRNLSITPPRFDAEASPLAISSSLVKPRPMSRRVHEFQALWG